MNTVFTYSDRNTYAMLLHSSGNGCWCTGLVPTANLTDADYLMKRAKYGVQTRELNMNEVLTKHSIHSQELLVVYEGSSRTLKMFVGSNKTAIYSATVESSTFPCRLAICGHSGTQIHMCGSTVTPTGKESFSGTLKNRDGVQVRSGSGSAIAGDMKVTASNVFYCSQRLNQCRCGSCDGRCGPTNGCPCNACKAFYLSNRMNGTTTGGATTTTASTNSSAVTSIPSQFYFEPDLFTHASKAAGAKWKNGNATVTFPNGKLLY